MVLWSVMAKAFMVGWLLSFSIMVFGCAVASGENRVCECRSARIMVCLARWFGEDAVRGR